MGDFEYLKLAVQVINVLVTVLLFVKVQSVNKEKANNEKFTTFEKEVTSSVKVLSERLGMLEVRVEKTPTHDDLAKIHEKINAVSDCVSRIEGEASGTAKTVDLIHDYLLNRDRA